MNQVDKAGTQYWDNNWTDANRPILFSEENKFRQLCKHPIA